MKHPYSRYKTNTDKGKHIDLFSRDDAAFDSMIEASGPEFSVMESDATAVDILHIPEQRKDVIKDVIPTIGPERKADRRAEEPERDKQKKWEYPMDPWGNPLLNLMLPGRTLYSFVKPPPTRLPSGEMNPAWMENFVLGSTMAYSGLGRMSLKQVTRKGRIVGSGEHAVASKIGGRPDERTKFWTTSRREASEQYGPRIISADIPEEILKGTYGYRPPGSTLRSGLAEPGRRHFIFTRGTPLSDIRKGTLKEHANLDDLNTFVRKQKAAAAAALRLRNKSGSQQTGVYGKLEKYRTKTKYEP